MDITEQNKTPSAENQPVYPEVTKGTFSDDHTTYATQQRFAGEDPDKHMGAYFVVFMIVIGLLFIFAVKLLGGGDFFF